MTGIACTVLVTAFVHINAFTLNDTQTLLADLQSGYDKNIRPVLEQSDVLHINISYDIYFVNGFSEVEGTLCVSTAFAFTWIDERMRWDPTIYNYTYSAVVPYEKIWAPKLILLNPADSVKPLTNDWSSVRFLYTGQAMWFPTDILRVSCAINIKYYPFDVQTCIIMLMAQTYASTELIINTVNKEAAREYYLENGEWDLIKTESSIADPGASIYMIKLVLARRPVFIVIIVIIPILLLSFLNILVFILPADSGERMSYTITLLLALAVFLTIISDNIPKTSSPLSILCYFIGAQVLLSTIICCVTICNLRLFFKDDSIPVPDWLCVCARKRRSSSPYLYTSEHMDTNVQTATVLNGNSAHSGNWKMYNKYGDSSTLRRRPVVKNRTHATWKDISICIDKVMIVFSLLFLLISCTVYTLEIVYKDDSAIMEFNFD